MKCPMLLCVIVAFAPRAACAHGGGLDASGGHWDRKAGTYHSHQRGRLAAPPPSRSPWPSPARPPAARPVGPVPAPPMPAAPARSPRPPLAVPPVRPQARPAPAPPPSRSVVIARAIDGDTVKTTAGEVIRLVGVDTPELRPRQPLGPEAAAFTRRLAQGKRVRLEFDALARKDKYGRTLAYVRLPDGTLLNAELLRQGYGRALLQWPFERLGQFRALEQAARYKRRGLWAP